MSINKTCIIKLSNQETVVKKIDKAIKEGNNYICLIAEENFISSLDKLINKIQESRIPIILYTKETSNHSEEIKKLMGSVPYVISGLFKDNINNFIKMLPDFIDNNKNNIGD